MADKIIIPLGDDSLELSDFSFSASENRVHINPGRFVAASGNAGRTEARNFALTPEQRAALHDLVLSVLEADDNYKQLLV